MEGLFHIYMGDGKGKSTAALGLALRAYGSGMDILYSQFLKAGDSSEHKALKLLQDHLSVIQNKTVKGFYFNLRPEEQEQVRCEQRELFQKVTEEMSTGKYQLVILDEVLHAINLGILNKQEVCHAVQERPKGVELVFTGRNAPSCLLDLADYVSEIVKLKHPYDQGIKMRKGIEY